MRRLCLFLVAASAGCNGGIFAAQGLVVDEAGKPVASARITGHHRTFTSDAAGCFSVFESTSVAKHDFPLAVQADRFPAIAGVLPAPGAFRLRVTVTRATTTFADAVAVNPPAGALGPCEPAHARVAR